MFIHDKKLLFDHKKFSKTRFIIDEKKTSCIEFDNNDQQINFISKIDPPYRYIKLEQNQIRYSIKYKFIYSLFSISIVQYYFQFVVLQDVLVVKFYD